MKIAVMMHGMSGNTNKYGTGNQLDVDISHGHFVENILKCNPEDQVDIFMHSWSLDSEKRLTELYSPKSKLFEEQIHFDFEYIVGDPSKPMNEGKTENGVFKGAENIRFHSLFSRWYSAKAVNDLRLQYEKINNIEYDLIILTRFDLAYLYPVVFSKFDYEKIYTISPPSNHGFHDLFFVGGSDVINTLCEMFNFVSSIKHFANWNIHSHRLVAHWIVEKIGYQNLAFLGPDRLWDAGSEGAKTGPAPLVRDHYSLFKINEEDPLERKKIQEIQSEAFSNYRQYSTMAAN